MAYAYTVKFADDGIIGVYSTMLKAEYAAASWVVDQCYDMVIDQIKKEKDSQWIWFTNGDHAYIERWTIE